MKKTSALKILLLFVCLSALGCTYDMRIKNADKYFAPPTPPLKTPLKIGLTSSNSSSRLDSKYIMAIQSALQSSGNFEKILYPYYHAQHSAEVDMVVDITVNPKYKGKSSNFWLDWPGFLISSPALWGYGYSVDIETMVLITHIKDNRTEQHKIPVSYELRQAAMNRTWTTAAGWILYTVPALVGGYVDMSYDDAITGEFIDKVSQNYGLYVSKKIVAVLTTGTSANQPMTQSVQPSNQQQPKTVLPDKK